MYLIKYIDNNVSSYTINIVNNKIIKYVTMIDENGLEDINSSILNNILIKYD